MTIPYSKTILLFITLLFQGLFVYQINLAYLQKGDIQIQNPETTQLFFDELSGTPKNYIINTNKDINLQVTLLKPESDTSADLYSADVFSLNNNQAVKLFTINGPQSIWTQEYDPLIREYYLQGPAINQHMPAGKYEIQVSSFLPSVDQTVSNQTDQTQNSGAVQDDNHGKYILKIGDNKSQDVMALLNMYWQVPTLKINFFKTSVTEFFLTPLGISLISLVGLLIIFLLIIFSIIGSIRKSVKQKRAKTLLLTSSGMAMKDEIITLLQKPTYDITIAFITTAQKDKLESPGMQKDLDIMREMRFNVAQIDIEGKKEYEVAKLLESKDIVYVEGGNTFRLLKAMRDCNFEKIIRKLLSQGKVYLGVSAGSIVAGKTIKTASWEGGDENTVGLKDLRGLNLVPFDIFVHFQAGDEEIIKKNMKSARERRKKLKIITDEQAILVQGSETIIIGEGNQIIV